jgi:hypothetical protein
MLLELRLRLASFRMIQGHRDIDNRMHHPPLPSLFLGLRLQKTQQKVFRLDLGWRWQQLLRYSHHLFLFLHLQLGGLPQVLQIHSIFPEQHCFH